MVRNWILVFSTVNLVYNYMIHFLEFKIFRWLSCIARKKESVQYYNINVPFIS